MSTDLKSMTKKELEKLKAQVNQQLGRIEKAEKKVALAAVQKEVRKFGFSLSELVPGTAASSPKSAKPKKPKKVSSPKYAHPENPSVTWTGKGRRPDWFKEARAAGISEDALLIK